MSLLRILVGVVIGAALLAGALALALQFPRAAAVVVLWLFGVGTLYWVILGLRRGAMSVRRSRYERRANPVSFWFYIIFYSVLAGLAMAYGVYCMMNPQSLR